MMLTTQEVLKLARISRATLCRWTRLGLCPAPVLLGPRTLRFNRAEIETWLQNGAVHCDPHGPVQMASTWLPGGHRLPDQATLAALSDEAADGEPASLNDLVPDPGDENTDQG